MYSVESIDEFILNIEPIQNENFIDKNVSVSMLRLDKIHPVISGNKIFKLHYFLEETRNLCHKTLITFGGAYSNHLAATAYTAKINGLNCIGFVCGEKPAKLSHTLEFCLANNMQLQFLSRENYDKRIGKEFIEKLTRKYGRHTLIPEGGFAVKGAVGAALIGNYFNKENFTHVCCAVGTATTFAGLITHCKNETNVIGFSVLKNLNDINERLNLLGVPSNYKYTIVPDYHFGGYAKKNAQLISFMNSFYAGNKIPLDFVYTGKMMFGIFDLIEKIYFPAHSKILCIHSGGLQGNDSLPAGTLNF